MGRNGGGRISGAGRPPVSRDSGRATGAPGGNRAKPRISRFPYPYPSQTNSVLRKLTQEELNRPSVAAFQQQAKRPIVVVLDNVRSLANVGAAFRTADAFAIEKLWLCGIT